MKAETMTESDTLVTELDGKPECVRVEAQTGAEIQQQFTDEEIDRVLALLVQGFRRRRDGSQELRHLLLLR